MKVFTLSIAMISLLIVGCSAGENKTEEIKLDDRNIGEDEFPVDDFGIYDAKVTLDITPHNMCGRMLVTEEFTITAMKEPGAFNINDSGEATYHTDSDMFFDLLKKYGDGYEGELPKNLAPRLIPFAVYKNGEKQPVLTTGDILSEGGGLTVSADTTVKIELENAETAQIKIIRSGYIESNPDGHPYSFHYSLSETFLQFGQLSVATVTAKFPRPPHDIEHPDWWHLEKESEQEYVFSIEPHAVRKEGDDWIVLTYPGDDKHFLKVLVNSVNFRTQPDNESPKVEGKQVLKIGEEVELEYIEGDWYRVTTGDDYRGWVRWRYEDPDTGRVNIYVEEFKTPY